MAVGKSLSRRSISGFQKNFFDVHAVMRGMEKADRRALSKFGSYVRTKARTSIRYGKKPSKPGKPPHAHKVGQRVKTDKKGVAKKQGFSPLRDFLFFAYEPETRAVVIGPALLNGSRNRSTTIPEVLEYGGDSILVIRLRSGNRSRRANYSARPFMQPALEAELPKLPEFYKDAM